MRTVYGIAVVRQKQFPQYICHFCLYIFIVIIFVQAALIFLGQAGDIGVIVILFRYCRHLTEKCLIQGGSIISGLIHQICPFHLIKRGKIPRQLFIDSRILLHCSIFKYHPYFLHFFRRIFLHSCYKCAVFVQRENKTDHCLCQRILFLQTVAVFHPHAGIGQRHQFRHIRIGLFPLRAVILMLQHSAVIGQAEIIFFHRRVFKGRSFSVGQSVQFPDTFIKIPDICIKFLIVHGVCFSDIGPILFCNVRLTAGTGIFIYFLHIIQHIKSGNPVSCPGTHAQAVFNGRASCVRPADQPSVSFLRGSGNLRLRVTSADGPAAMPSGNAAGSCSQRRVVIGSLYFAGHIAVFNQSSILCFPHNSSDSHQTSDRNIQRRASADC